MLKVIHLIPSDGVGGVETAARSLAGSYDNDLEFQVAYIYPPIVDRKGRLSLFNPLPLLHAVRLIVGSKPDLLVVSLWRSCIVALLSRLLFRRLRIVLFLHSPKDAHWLDHLMTRWAARLAEQIWADSRDTLDRRLSRVPHGRGKIISFVTQRNAPLPAQPLSPSFIYWGRLHRDKGLDRALTIFSAVRREYQGARFTIIGPDDGDLARIKALAGDLCLEDAIDLPGSMSFDEIRKWAAAASFYLQTSTLEGMAMSVVEAMQLGLVPIVTPAGEIGNYCRHKENALIVQSDDMAIHDIQAVLRDNAKYQELRRNAIDTWNETTLYGDSVLRACTVLLANKPYVAPDLK